MQFMWRTDPGQLRDRLAAAEAAELTYAEVGVVAGAAAGVVAGVAVAAGVPAGYAALHQSTPAGQGPAAWARLADALMSWRLHREAGMLLGVRGDEVQVGDTVVNAAPVGPVALLAPCRVIAVVDEPRRRGFAYGTLPGHPLRGEEQFTVDLDAAGVVHLSIRSFSRPVGLARLAPVAARAGQRWVNRRYARAARRIAG